MNLWIFNHYVYPQTYPAGQCTMHYELGGGLSRCGREYVEKHHDIQKLARSLEGVLLEIVTE